MREINVGVNNSERFLVLDLLLSNVYKAQNIPTFACHVTLSIGMNRLKNKRLELFDNLEI